LKKIFTKLALALVALVFLFAIVSFLRENWSALDTPGVVETFLAKWALRQAQSAENGVQNPVQPTPENLEEGRRYYEKECAFCHGLDGNGQGQTGLQFYPPVPPLTARANEMTDGQLQATVSKGIRYSAMPAFAKELSAEEIWKVVLWVRKVSHKTEEKK